MRGKIIAVFAVVVLVVTGLSYALTRATLGDLSTPGEAPRALNAASALIQLDGLVLERWLAAQASIPKVREPFNAGTPNAKAEEATSRANSVREAASATPELAGISPALVLLVDKNGVVLGRNGSALMRGDNLGALYPALKATLTRGATGSDVWFNKGRNEQYLTSYATIRDGEGQIIGGLVVGTALNDERLNNASERTSGKILLVGMRTGDNLDILAKSSAATPDLVAAISAAPAKDAVLHALTAGQSVEVGGLARDLTASAHALDGYGDGKRAVVIGIARLQTPAILGSLIWPALGVTLLGLLLVSVGAYFLDAYISRPISEIEDGLLAIMNGKTDTRFELEHAELGGLVFRLNSALNLLNGVQEDETDDQGRPSRAPAAESFSDALEVDERMAALSGGEVADAGPLRNEPEDAYYGRIFGEYIAAKTSLGDPVDHIHKDAFITRIRASEQEMGQKHGKPVRYKVDVRGREVVLLAVPLA